LREKSLLKIEDLKTYFFTVVGTVKAIDGVNLEIREGESVGLVGESGSGKSTLAFSILKIVPPPGKIVGGKILFKGSDLVKKGEDEMRKIRGKEIAMVFQDPSVYLNPVLKIGDQLTEGITLHLGLSKKDANSRAIEILSMLGIPAPEEVMRYYPHQLSGGMKQRVIIGMAIVRNPSLLIADEPTTALDVTVQSQILELLKELKRKLKLSLLLISHDLGVIADTCERVYIMYAGRICEMADVFNLYNRPFHPYTKRLLDSAVSVYEGKKELDFIDGVVPNLINPPSGCPFAPRCDLSMKRCLEEFPPLTKIGNRIVYCWRWVKR
jgi:peptide/nickel transport system ATP-binding protein/oligopeptide transport system ATP-binding protein